MVCRSCRGDSVSPNNGETEAFNSFRFWQQPLLTGVPDLFGDEMRELLPDLQISNNNCDDLQKTSANSSDACLSFDEKKDVSDINGPVDNVVENKNEEVSELLVNGSVNSTEDGQGETSAGNLCVGATRLLERRKMRANCVAVSDSLPIETAANVGSTQVIGERMAGGGTLMLVSGILRGKFVNF